MSNTKRQRVLELTPEQTGHIKAQLVAYRTMEGYADPNRINYMFQDLVESYERHSTDKVHLDCGGGAVFNFNTMSIDLPEHEAELRPKFGQLVLDAKAAAAQEVHA